MLIIERVDPDEAAVVETGLYLRTPLTLRLCFFDSVTVAPTTIPLQSVVWESAGIVQRILVPGLALSTQTEGT